MTNPGQNLPRLRLAEDVDAEAITGLINAAFRVERFFLDRDRIESNEVRDRLASGKFILAEEQGALTGCVYVELRGERAYLGLLSVDPSRQRSGIGRCLMAAAEKHCRTSGCSYMDLLIVNLRPELPGIYHKFGYVESGIEPFPADANPKLPCHFVLMSKQL